MSSRTVLCHIQDWQRIPVVQCLYLQNEKAAKECFGCDACSRLCAKCRRKKPVCPEMDMCKRCLENALLKEKLLAEDPLAKPYDWQICVACKKRVVYYGVYGLCLHCSAKEFVGIVRQPFDEAELEEPAVPVLNNGHSSILRTDDEEHDEFSPNGDLDTLISGLSEIEQIIMVLRHRESYSMNKIGEVLQLSESMVSKIYTEAVGKIRKSENL